MDSFVDCPECGWKGYDEDDCIIEEVINSGIVKYLLVCPNCNSAVDICQ